MNLQATDRFVADRISAHRARSPEGYLIALSVPIARTGTQTYRAEEVDKEGVLGLSGLVEVYRSPEEVFKPASMLSFEGKSVVSPHPPQFLNKDNDSTYSKGHAQNIRRGERLPDGEYALIADLVFKDAGLITLIEDGHRVEISGGYTYDLDRQDNEHSSNARFLQRNIMGNHIAIVPTGRAGSDIKVLDAQPEEGENMAEEVAAKPGIVAETLSSFSQFFTGLGLRLVSKDEDPGAVERNRKKDEEALKLKSRVEDEKDPKMDKEDKKAGPPEAKPQGEDKKGEDKKEGQDSLIAALDAGFARVIDALKSRDAKCTCDAEEGEGHKKSCEMYKKESEDSDLIPIETLHGEEVPKNPIPGADAALSELRKIRPFIAKHGTKEAKDAYNKAVRQLKEASDSGDGDYADFTQIKKPEKVENDEIRAHASDSAHKGEDSAADFEKAAASFHRMNANEVKRQ